MEDERIIVGLAQPYDYVYAREISEETKRSAIARGSGISQRSLNSIIEKITAGKAIMKLNTRLGFKPVTYSDIAHNETFWEGCKSCINHNILGERTAITAFVWPCCLTWQKISFTLNISICLYP